MPKHKKDTPLEFAHDIVAMERIATKGSETPQDLFKRLVEEPSARAYCGGAISWENALFEALGFGTPTASRKLEADLERLRASLNRLPTPCR